MIILDINVSFVALLVWWSYITFILKTISTEFAAVIHSFSAFFKNEYSQLTFYYFNIYHVLYFPSIERFTKRYYLHNLQNF